MEYLLHALDHARSDEPYSASRSLVPTIFDFSRRSEQHPPMRASSHECEIADALVISDLHLGSENCQARLITQFLELVADQVIRTRRLIINGDVFDSIDFRRLKKTHWKVLSMLRRLSDKMEVIWTCGNHDGPAEIISHLLGVEVHDEYIFNSGGRRMRVLHGHRFDDFIDDHPVLTWLADVAYNTLQKLDRRHYVARLAKSRSKIFLHCLDKVEDRSTAHAKYHQCDVVICGHTHHAIRKQRHAVEYVNSGCWTELPSTWLKIFNGVIEIHKFHPLTIAATPMPATNKEREVSLATA